MSTDQTLVSSSSRPFRVRLRSDLSFVRHVYQGRDYWVVKDPLTLKFYRFEEEEFALLQMLDGQTSPDQIRRRFASKFAPQKITNQELFQFVGSLYRSALLVSDASGQASPLLERADKNRRRQLRGSLTNILAIRIRGFDPDGLLSWLHRYLRWVFSWPAFLAGLLLLVSAGVLILTHFEQFQQKLPAFHEFFAAKNWLWLGVTLALTKVLHEFGHGLACKRFGSQCHSMGVMFLVLMPCLYCDVSDSWTLPNKWKRAAIAAAGMYFEFVLAAMAAFVWWYSQPGTINMLALNVVFICSVSTLLFNANPLLRFDGYYILSDLIEIPNLRQKASSILHRASGRWLLGLQHSEDPFLPKTNRWLFIAYSIAAVIYRWLITASIFWFLYQLLEPYGLKLIGQAIAMMAIYGLIGIPLVQLVRYFSVPGRIGAVNPIRFGVTAAVMCLLIVAMLLIPTPHNVRCSFIVQPQKVANVFVEVPGQVQQILARENQQVRRGQPLLVLESPELVESVTRLEGDANRAKSRYHATVQQAHFDQSAEKEVEASLATYQAITQHLEQRRQDLARLVISAPIDGQILTASHVPPPESDSGRLGTWHGHPLQKRNQKAFLEQGTIVCQLAPTERKLEATLAIDQSDIEYIKSGQPVKLWFRQLPGTIVKSTIDTISPQEMQFVPKALAGKYGGTIVTTTDANGLDKPQSTIYQVRVPLDDFDRPILAGATGVAKIRAGHLTVGQRIWRFICHTFRFEL